MVKLILIRGLPGSGKSTLAKQLLNAGAVDKHFENDDYFLDDHGVYRYDPMQVGNAAAHCFERTNYALGCGHRVVVANTFSRQWEAESYFHLVKKCTDMQILMCFGCWDNVHNVPFDTIERMKARWEWF